MYDFKHTPGPWVTSEHYEDCMIILDPRGYEIVTAESTPILSDYVKRLGIQHWSDDERGCLNLSQEEQAANARLIAAAPELLDVLLQALPHVREQAKVDGHAFGTLQRMCEIIKKTQGKLLNDI